MINLTGVGTCTNAAAASTRTSPVSSRARHLSLMRPPFGPQPELRHRGHRNPITTVCQHLLKRDLYYTDQPILILEDHPFALPTNRTAFRNNRTLCFDPPAKCRVCPLHKTQKCQHICRLHSRIERCLLTIHSK